MPANEILISHANIQNRLPALAAEIRAALPAGPLHIIMILKSTVFFGVDLARALMRDATLDFLSASSYGAGEQSAGRVNIDASHLSTIKGRNVLLIDDILDTGHTLSSALALLRGKRPASVRTCVLLDKPARRELGIEADYVGFTIADHFVVGYGLDYGEAYRTLPDIRIYTPKESPIGDRHLVQGASPSHPHKD